MRKIYTPSLTAKKLFFLLLSILSLRCLQAQTDVAIGNGSTGNAAINGFPCPIQDYWEGSRAQYLYTAAELSAAGMSPGTITAIKFNVSALNAAGLVEKYSISIGTTAANSLDVVNWEPGTTQVYGPVDYQPVAGINTFTFSTPFIWNGTSNIVIEICNGEPSNATGTWFTENPTVTWTTGLSFNGSHTTASDNLGNGCGSTALATRGTPTTRPDIIFSWVSNTVCSGTPAGGTAQSSATNICGFTTPFTVSVTGSTAASGLTYQWQRSSDNVSWTDITGATGSTYTSSGITTATYFRRKITCGSISSFSASVQVTLAPASACTCTTGIASNTADEDIFNVTVGSLSQSSTCTTTGTGPTSIQSRYSDYTTGGGAPGAPDLAQATSVPFSVEIGTCGGNFGNATAIWIDFDQSGTFDASERVYLSPASTTGPHIETGNFSVPANAALGLTRMRVITVETATPTSITACGGYTWGETEDYLVNIVAGTPCNGAPTGGTASTASTSICGGTPFVLSVTGSTANVTGLSYQWQSSPDGVIWTDIPGATGETYSNTGTTTTLQYRRKITCGANSSFSTSVTVTVRPFYTCYCTTSLASNTADEDIFNVTVGSLSQTSDCGTTGTGPTSILNRYSDYSTGTGAPAAPGLAQATRIPFSVQVGSCGGNFNNGIAIFIDFNRNGTYDAAERVYFSPASTLGPHTETGTFIVPDNAVVGLTGMRVVAVETTTPNTISACGGYTWGETEDYVVNILPGTPCAGTPVGGTTVTANTNVCPNIPFSLSVSGSSTLVTGLSYQWQTSPDGVSWTDISGAVDSVYTHPGTSTTIQIRRRITCSGVNSFSTPITITINSPAYASLPYTESFENVWLSTCDVRDVPNNFWRNTPITGNHSWRRNDDAAAANWTNPALGVYTPDASAGLYSARFHSYGSTTGTKGRFDLYVNAAPGSPTKRLRFDFINGTGADSLTILLSTNGGTSFVRLDSAGNATFWRTKEIVFTSTSATTVIRFEATGVAFSNDIGLDNITLINFPACSGVPVGGTTASTSNNVCPSTPFTLSVTGATDASGITYQWQSSTNGGTTWSAIAGATSFNYTSAGITAATTYRRKIICGTTDSSFSSAITITLNLPTYASLPFAESFENTWLSVCGLRDVPNNSWRNSPVSGNSSWRRNDDGDAAGWTGPTNWEYTPTASAGIYSARFHSGEVTTRANTGLFSLYINASSPSPAKRLSFDYINMGTTGSDSITIMLSTDGGASFVRLDSTRLANVWTTKTIDFTSTSSITVIRFVGTGDFGVTDMGIDNILITDFAPCTGIPIGGTTISSATTVCSEPFTLRLQGSTSGAGITYQWQSAPSATGPWTDITGATGFTYTTSQVGTTWYRARVTCTFSGETGNSTPLQIVSPPLVSGVFTINNALPTTIPTNFTSFNDAYNYIRCGINGPVVFNVVDNAATPAGVYNEQLIMAPVPGASAAFTVTFKGRGATIAYSANNTNERAVIKLRGADHIRFDSLKISAGTGTYGYGVQLISNADSNVISNCIITTSTTSTALNYGGIIINGTETGVTSTGTTLCDSNSFINNDITGGYVGMSLVATLTSANLNNRFVNNKVKDFYLYGMYVGGAGSTLIEGNTFSRPTRTVLTTFNGIYFSGISTKSLISKNRITNPCGGNLANTDAFNGINFQNVDATTDNENIISNNLIYGINGEGAQVGLSNTGSDNAWYYYNTISLDSAGSGSTATSRGIFQTTAATGIQYANNMVTIGRGGTGAKHAIYMATTATGFVSDYNNFFINALAGTRAVGFFTSDRITLNDWRAATGQDGRSISRNPFYSNPLVGNLMPTNGAVDNKGIDIGSNITTDILNAPRNLATPDIGAFEFIAPPCTTPPDAGNTVFNDTTVCQNSSVRLYLTVAAFGGSQTFQWQTATSASGPWTNFGNALSDPDTTIIANTSLFYRAAVTCGASTSFSNALQLLVSPALPAGNYTIIKGSPNSYVPGVPGGNFQSFALAKAAMDCGIVGNGPVVFDVVAGQTPFVEQLRLDSIPGTSAVSTITFRGNGNTLAFTNITNTNERAVLKLSGADHIRFDSLRIDASAGTTYGYGVQLQNNADSNAFTRCTILTSVTATNTNYAGVVINASESGAITNGATGCDSNTFNRNTVIGGAYGVTLMGGTTIPTYINNNRFTNNTISEFYNYGFYIGGTIGTLMESNVFTRPTRTNTATNVYGVYNSGAPSRNLSISKNRFHRFFGGITGNTAAFYGVYHNNVDGSAGSEMRVTNNLIYKIEGNGPAYAFYNLGSDNVFYFHNTISFDNTASTAAGQTVALYHTTAATGIFFYNNIVSITRGGTGSKYGVYMGTLPTTGTYVESNNNNYYISGANGFIGFRGTTNYGTLAAWQAASAQDGASFALNPLFADIANDNYKPQLAALDNKGRATSFTGVTTDIDNVTRSAATPDMGAYEYAPTPCQNPPVAGTASITPSSGICLESPVHLDITGNSPLGNITFQWQSAPSASGPWTNLSPVQFFPGYDTLTTTNTFYRAAVTCSGTTTYTNVVSVTLNPLLVTGTYTINKSNATNYVGVSGANFNSFQDAVTAMNCGITGPVVFNVVSNTYTEQITIPYIRNTNAVNTVTFQSQTGNAADVTLTTAGTPTNNFTLRLDSTRWFTFRNMSFSGTDATNGRVIELLDSASNNTFFNNRITSPSVTAIGTGAAGIYAATFKGRNNLIRKNTIVGGSAGIFISGTSAANLNRGLTIDSNSVSGFFQYGIYNSFVHRVNLNANTVGLADTLATPSYGIYASDADSAYSIKGNNVTFTNTGASRTVYGLYVNNSDSAVGGVRSLLTNNKITSIGPDNKAVLYGMYVNNSPGTYALNNVISLNTSGGSSYGLYHNNTTWARYYNNTVQSTATSATNNHAAYFNTAATSDIQVRNNIFSHRGGGRAMYVAAATQSLLSDYNMLYTTGPVLVQSGTPAGNWATLATWKNAAFWDLNSIVYAPAFVSATDLRPDVANPDVWAMHGRGVQIAGNDADINGAVRPTTLRNPTPGIQTTGGVPDLGAYEFLPTVQPTLLAGTPATPAANTTQTFMFGTDTVMKITWGATAPPTSGVRRYSGVVPTGLAAANLDSMYFYTQVEVPNRDLNGFNVRLHYLDPWQGSIPDQNQLGLGKTIQQGSWTVGFPSRVDVSKKVIFQNGLSWADKFTGLVNPYAPPVIPDKDSSNRGRRFWVGYPINQLNGGQDMVLYLTATETANVQVKINGTNWVRNYIVPANTVRVSDILPKTGVDNAFINQAGLTNRGISITSDVPIVAYSHVYGSASSGASMLLPVGVWGYEYKMLGITQDYGLNSYSYYYVIADNDSTWVQVTSQAGIALQAGNAGITPGTASLIKLNKGEYYQIVASSQTEELSGSLVRSVPNSQGKCFPIAVFSGTSRTAIDVGCGSGGDFMMQQNFPSTAWGKRYLTAPSSASGSASTPETNIFRVAVKDPTTIVKRNGVVLGGLQRNFYYEFQSNTADYIEADKPITVAQFLAGSCDLYGDPEMIYISPIEQAIDKIAFYRNTQQAIQVNYLTMIVPKGGTGLSSLVITDGAAVVTPDYTYDHPQFPSLYKVVIKRWTSQQQQVRVQSDSAFTAITYGQGSVESYGYNAGTLVKTLRAQGNISNTLSSTGGVSDFTCSGAPFRFTALLPLRATSITFKLSQVPGLTPNADVTLTNPVPNDSTVINGTKYYIFRLSQDYTFSAPGLYPVQINWAHPDIESCDKTAQDIINVQVVPAPNAGFTFTPAVVCSGNQVQFNGEALTQNGVVVNQWQWSFPGGSTATTQTTNFTFANAGNFDVKLRSITPDGCLKDSIRTVAVNARPVVTLVQDSINVCPQSNVTFTVQNPVAGVTYNWYNAQTGGTLLGTGTTFTAQTVTANGTYWVEGVSAVGCNSSARTRARVFPLGPLTQAVVRVVGQDINSVTFGWDPVPGAASYEVSVRGGTFVPANGAPNLTHTVTNLRPLDTVSVVVRALGVLTCQTSVSQSVTGRSLPDQIFIPNSFSPNGDGLNDRLMVYGYTIKDMQFTVFNQWGEKIFESRSQNTGWDGTVKGKMQPSGVYIYVAKFTLKDGAIVERKGTINLVR